MTATTCPRCSETFTTTTIEGEEVGACPVGHGVWLQLEQLERIADDDVDEASPASEDVAWTASEIEPRGLTDEKFRTCPVCSQTLRKDVWRYGSGVVIDVCDEHGAWVDSGEIERIESWEEAWDRHTSATAD